MRVRAGVLHFLSIERSGHTIAVQLTPHGRSSYQDVFLAVVLGEGSLAAKALTTSINHALVGSLASVDTTMACQGTAVAESLLALWVLADVWSLSSMCALVDREGRPLDERLCATRLGAKEGSFIGVDASVTSQIRSARERLATMGPGAAERSRIMVVTLRMD